MEKARIIFKIFYSYILVGLVELWVSVGFLLLRDGYLNYKPTTGVLTIFLWPVFSFFSSSQVFGREGAYIWNYLNISQVFLFFAFVLFLLRSESK